MMKTPEELTAELDAARRRIAELEHHSRAKAGIGELAPPWIAALATLLAALTGIGFFAGRASNHPGAAPSTSSSTPGAVKGVIATDSPTPAPTPSPTTGGPVFLSAQQLPPPKDQIGGVTSGSVTIGGKAYPNSIRFTCAPYGFGGGSLTFTVAGYAFFNAVVGVPDDSNNGVGNSMKITFLKDGATQLATPLTIVVGQPQTVHLNLQGAVQLQVECASKSKGGLGATMDGALGDASVSAS